MKILIKNKLLTSKKILALALCFSITTSQAGPLSYNNILRNIKAVKAPGVIAALATFYVAKTLIPFISNMINQDKDHQEYSRKKIRYDLIGKFAKNTLMHAITPIILYLASPMVLNIKSLHQPSMFLAKSALGVIASIYTGKLGKLILNKFNEWHNTRQLNDFCDACEHNDPSTMKEILKETKIDLTKPVNNKKPLDLVLANSTLNADAINILAKYGAIFDEDNMKKICESNKTDISICLIHDTKIKLWYNYKLYDLPDLTVGKYIDFVKEIESEEANNKQSNYLQKKDPLEEKLKRLSERQSLCGIM